MIKLGTKVYRNIQEQVAKNTQDIAKIQRKPVLQVKKVDELPEEGEEGILYLLPASDPEEGNYYEEYLWIDGAWELIGTTAVDISNMCTTDTAQTITGAKTLAFDLNPATSNTYDLGSSSYQWKDLYLSGKAYFKNTASTNAWAIDEDAYDELRFLYNGATKFYIYNGFAQTQGLRPIDNNTYDLGTSSKKWKELYLSGAIDFSGRKLKYDTGYVALTDSTNAFNSILIGDTVSLFRNVQPLANNLYDIGSSSMRWKDIHLSENIDFNGIATIETLSDRVKAKYNGVDGWEWGNNSYRVFTPLATAAVYPTSDGQKDIGLSSQRYKDVYLSGNISDGANSASVADLAALITYAKAQGWIS